MPAVLRARRGLRPRRHPVARAPGGGRLWRLSGQKVWTTNAQYATYGLLLARTDADLPKHKGLTMFIVPMDAEGVTIRPLRQISGEAHFNEVFFDDVHLEPGSEVGPVNGGWGVGLTTLMFERVAIGLGGEGFGWRADRFAAGAARGPGAPPRTRRSATATARSPPTSSPCASPATGC